MSQFNIIKSALQQKFASIQHLPLFVSNASKDELWDTYINTLTASGHNEIYRERGEHDCQCCKHYIRKVGNVIALVDGELVSIWDVQTGSFYDEACEAMSNLVKSKGIRGIFLSDTDKIGTDSNVELLEDNTTHTWEHFYQELTEQHVITDGYTRRKKLGEAGDNYGSLKLSMQQITRDAVITVMDLIEDDAIYRGAEHKATVQLMQKLHREYDAAPNKEHWLWLTSRSLGNRSTLRSTVIGSLLKDVSSGMEVEQAVKSFEAKVAPANYKRTSAVITKGMIKNAEQKVVDLGLTNSLPRRHASIQDITINNVLFSDKTAQEQMGGVFGQLMAETSDNINVDNAVPIGIEEFLSTIVPNVDSMEAYFENKNTGNMMTLVAPVYPDAPNMLKWDNNFTWTYNGDVTDSMREQVIAKGGRVDGAFRFTHSWNHDGQNQSLMDLHVFLPTHSGHKDGIHNSYGDGNRVGWNNRKHTGTHGIQDVDFTSPPGKEVPIENISFPELRRMPEGTYTCKIHNWNSRMNPKSGFKAEIEFNGQIFEYEYNKAVKHHEWITVAEVTLKDGQFSIDHKLPSSTSSKEVWNVSTQKLHRISAVMLSPNYWDDNSTGNKHYFFLLDGMRNPDSVRGFYNEFLSDELRENRKVFEVLGNKMKADFREDQLSGLGFSSTVRNSLVVRTKGNNGQRLYKVNF